MDEITPKIENFDESKHVKIPDCGNKICKKLFGLNRPHLFCEMCTDKEPKKYWQKRTLCTLCGQSVQTIAMKEHMIVAHNKEKHICTICKVEKPSLNRLKHHMNINHIRIPCEHCGKLLGKAMMKRHIRDCHSSYEDKKFKCEVCGTFATNAEDRLKVHMNIHTGDRPYKCNYCPKDFSHRSALNVHKRKHTGYIHNCDECGKSFANNQQLSDHTNIHTGEKPHKCKYCDARFASHSSHAVHQRSHLGISRGFIK